MSEKTVYACFCTDIIHEGHLNIIREANKLGGLTVGVLCDSEMVRYTRYLTKNTEERVKMVEGLDGVDQVVIQNSLLYDDVIEELHPDYVIHGSNWQIGPMSKIREHLIILLNTYGGELYKCCRCGRNFTRGQVHKIHY